MLLIIWVKTLITKFRKTKTTVIKTKMEQIHG